MQGFAHGHAISGVRAVFDGRAPGTLTASTGPVSGVGGRLFQRLELPLKRQDLRFGDSPRMLIEGGVLTHERNCEIAEFLAHTLKNTVPIGHGTHCLKVSRPSKRHGQG
jgi:hypothetical protein